MRMSWFLFVPVFAVSACHAAGGDAATVLEKYLSVHEALATDDLAGAKKALGSLAEAGDGEIRKLAGAAASAGDLEKVRAAFKPLSAAIARIELPDGYVIASCPMADSGKGASWVQKDGKVRNPYYGSAMLTCGTIQKK